jgi:aldose 1-epimerase
MDIDAALFDPGAASDGTERVMMAGSVEPFGTSRGGKKVEKVTLTNDAGMILSYIDYGATITAIEVPDRRGDLANVMLNLPDLAAYETTRKRHAAIIGRYAGRIAQARFTLDGKVIQLPDNGKGLALHSDPDGFDKRVWRRQDFTAEDSLGSVFHMECPEGDQGYPGRLAVEVTYRLMKARTVFRIEYRARTDTPTVINLTNHGFFNLAGAGTRGVDSHVLKIAADRLIETDERIVPTGRLPPIGGAYDFREPANLGDRLEALSPAPGFDTGYVFSRWTGRLAKVVTLDEPLSGRRMEISTTQPCLQFFSGNNFDGSEANSYQRHDGLAFETQHLPDSPNHPNFPSTELRPGQVFRSVTSYRFSTLR